MFERLKQFLGLAKKPEPIPVVVPVEPTEPEPEHPELLALLSDFCERADRLRSEAQDSDSPTQREKLHARADEVDETIRQLREIVS